MEAFFTETTRLRDSITIDEFPAPEQYGGVEYMANEELLAADPPPFSWKDLMSLLDQQRIVWLNAEVFLFRENMNGASSIAPFMDWVLEGGYARLCGLGGSSTTGDYIAFYTLAAEDPQTAQATSAWNFLADLFCLGGGDSAFIVGRDDDSDDDALSQFISKISEDVASLLKLELRFVRFTEVSCRALATLSGAADSRLEIVLQQCHVPNNVGDAILSYLRQGHGRTALNFCELPLRVLSQALRANTCLRHVSLALSSIRTTASSIEDSVAELTQSLTMNEGLEFLHLDEDTGDSAASDASLRILCEGRVAHPTLKYLYLKKFFLLGIPLSLEDQERRAKYIQQLLKSNTLLKHVRLSVDEMEEPFYAEFIRPYLEINRFRGRFRAVRNDPLQVKLLAPALAGISDLPRHIAVDKVSLIHFFLSENREAIVGAVLGGVAPLTRVTGRVHARAPDEWD